MDGITSGGSTVMANNLAATAAIKVKPPVFLASLPNFVPAYTLPAKVVNVLHRPHISIAATTVHCPRGSCSQTLRAIKIVYIQNIGSLMIRLKMPLPAA